MKVLFANIIEQNFKRELKVGYYPKSTSSMFFLLLCLLEWSVNFAGKGKVHLSLFSLLPSLSRTCEKDGMFRHQFWLEAKTCYFVLFFG